MTTTTKMRERVKEAADRWRYALVERERARADLANAIWDASTAGVSISEISRIANITRTTAYHLIAHIERLQKIDTSGEGEGL